MMLGHWIIVAFALWGLLIAVSLWRWDREVKALMADRGVADPSIRKAHWLAAGPRAGLYRFLASLSAFASTAILWPLATTGWRWLWNYYGRPGDLEEGLAPWTFFMAVAVVAGWVLVGSVFVYLYHLRGPSPSERINARALERGDAFI